MVWLSFIELDKAVVHVISTPAVTDLAEAWLRGATPHPRSGVVAERSYPTSEVRGSSQECQAARTQEKPKGATPCTRSREVA